MIMADRLRAQDVFEFLSPKQLDTIAEHSMKVKCSAGDTVYTMGENAEHLYTVLDGQVALRLPGRDGVSITIDQLTQGATFGSCVSFHGGNYALTAQCTEDTVLLKTRASVLKSLMDEDLVMGYALQGRISQIYFNRYLETMKKLQAIVLNIPIESS
jgi:CRP-like cAMP-binding protein